MRECLQERGYGFQAGWRCRERASGVSGKIPRPLRQLGDGDFKLAVLQSSSAPAAGHGGAGAMRVTCGNLPPKPLRRRSWVKIYGRERGLRLPGLMVAINWCNVKAGRITPDVLSSN